MKAVLLSEKELDKIKSWLAVYAFELPKSVVTKGHTDPLLGTIPDDSQSYKVAKKLFGKSIADLFANK